MATYAVGDIQGCYNELRRLLDKAGFDPTEDRLWLVGDLVNRGPGSLDVLRFVRSLGDSAITVLGNHDLHLLAVAAEVAKLHRSDTLDELLNAADRDELLYWLRQQRLFYAEGSYALVHAGLLPSWTVPQALALSREVEAALRSDNYAAYFAHMYGNAPLSWSDELSGFERLRLITNAFTRMRVCTPQGKMEFKFKGEVHKIPPGYLPWFDVPGRASRDTTMVVGHWSALGLKVTPNLIALDTGCLWGGPMTAIRLEDRQLFQVSCDSPVAQDW